MLRPLIRGFRLGIYVFKDAEGTVIADVARVMEYHVAYERYREDLERASAEAQVGR